MNCFYNLKAWDRKINSLQILNIISPSSWINQGVKQSSITFFFFCRPRYRQFFPTPMTSLRQTWLSLSRWTSPTAAGDSTTPPAPCGPPRLPQSPPSSSLPPSPLGPHRIVCTRRRPPPPMGCLCAMSPPSTSPTSTILPKTTLSPLGWDTSRGLLCPPTPKGVKRKPWGPPISGRGLR